MKSPFPMFLRRSSLIITFAGNFIEPSAPGHFPERICARFLPTEIELARIQMTMTVHCESASFRGRATGGRILYRYCDEWESEQYDFIRFAFRSSKTWPTLGQLIYLLDYTGGGDYGGLVFGWAEEMVAEATDRERIEELDGCVIADSHFYPDLKRWYDEALHRFVAAAVPGGKDPGWGTRLHL